MFAPHHLHQTRLRQSLYLGLAALLFVPVCSMTAQDAPTPGQGRRGQGGQFAGMQRTAGEVTAVAGANITIKTEDGGTMQVVTTDNTRVMKGNTGGASGEPTTTPVKVSDLKPGDGLTAMGNLDAPNKALHAAIVIVVDAAQIKAMKANWGKTYIAGKVTSINLDDAKMTVQRPDGPSITIGFDETTSFKRGRVNINAGLFGEAGGFGGNGGGRRREGGNAPPLAESITLADIKVGDSVAGQGSVKGGIFVPGELTVATPGQGRRRPPSGEGAPATATPPSN